MMQAFEEKMRSLRRRVRHWLEPVREPPETDSELIASRRSTTNFIASGSGTDARLARDLGLPRDEVSRILDRTAADLRELSEKESDDADARPIIERAASELARLGYQSRPFEEKAMDRYLQQLPEADFQILRLFKLGKKHRQIAAEMNISIDAVRDSLVKTYAELRMRMLGSSDDGGGGGEPCELPPSQTYTNALKQTSLHHG